MGEFAAIFRDVKSRYDKQRALDAELICAEGFHMNCDVLKLRKASWTNDDVNRINSPTGGIFFSIWISESGSREGRASYNIHSYGLQKLKAYRIASNDFCDQFRAEFAEISRRWPNVSTDFSCQTLMGGRFKIRPTKLADDVLLHMNRFGTLASIIDGLLAERAKKGKSRKAVGKNGGR